MTASFTYCNSWHTACSAMLQCVADSHVIGACTRCRSEAVAWLVGAKLRAQAAPKTRVLCTGSTQAKMLELTVTGCWQTLPRLAQLQEQELCCDELTESPKQRPDWRSFEACAKSQEAVLATLSLWLAGLARRACAGRPVRNPQCQSLRPFGEWLGVSQS